MNIIQEINGAKYNFMLARLRLKEKPTRPNKVYLGKAEQYEFDRIENNGIFCLKMMGLELIRSDEDSMMMVVAE